MFQTIILAGNLGKDPEMRYTPGGQAVTTLSVASNRTYTDSSGNQVKQTIWFRVSVWGKQAEQCNQFLTKGQQVYVEGRLHARNWQGQDGQMRTSLEVTANRVVFLGRASGTATLPDEGDIAPSDIPFEQN